MVEYLKGRMEDGTLVTAQKTTSPMPGYAHLNLLPRFTLNGKTLTPASDDLSVFRVVQTGQLVTIVG